MKMVNNKTENPLKYYREKTGEFDPHELSLKSGVPFDGKEFHLTVTGKETSFFIIIVVVFLKIIHMFSLPLYRSKILI